MGFGILTASVEALHQAIAGKNITADDPGAALDIIHDVLALPKIFQVADGPFLRSYNPDERVWILASDEIPLAINADRLPSVVPLYVRHTDPDGSAYTTLDRIEIRAGADYHLLTTIPCAVTLA